MKYQCKFVRQVENSWNTLHIIISRGVETTLNCNHQTCSSFTHAQVKSSKTEGEGWIWPEQQMYYRPIELLHIGIMQQYCNTDGGNNNERVTYSASLETLRTHNIVHHCLEWHIHGGWTTTTGIPFMSICRELVGAPDRNLPASFSTQLFYLSQSQ